jgi:hypothetical protein
MHECGEQKLIQKRACFEKSKLDLQNDKDYKQRIEEEEIAEEDDKKYIKHAINDQQSPLFCDEETRPFAAALRVESFAVQHNEVNDISSNSAEGHVAGLEASPSKPELAEDRPTSRIKSLLRSATKEYKKKVLL